MRREHLPERLEVLTGFGKASRLSSDHSLIPVSFPVRMRQPTAPSQSLLKGTFPMCNILLRLWTDDQGQDIAEYAVMLAVILVLVVGTVRLVGSNANNAFSSVASSLQ
jgi:Flp pilus assembly pilin Flp